MGKREGGGVGVGVGMMGRIIIFLKLNLRNSYSLNKWFLWGK